MTLYDELRRLTVEEVVSFQEHFAGLLVRAKRYDLAGATCFLNGGCSDDGFIDFRGWLVSRGRTAYENALDDPDSLIDVVEDHDGNCQFEDFFYLASTVWTEKTGLDIDKQPEVFYLDAGDPQGDEVPEDDMEAMTRRYPRLSERWARLESQRLKAFPGLRL